MPFFDNECDNCGEAADLFHNEATGLAFCQACDATDGEEVRMPAITTTLVADKVTKGAVRFTEPEALMGDTPLSIYLRKEMVEALGLEAEEGKAVKITLDRP